MNGFTRETETLILNFERLIPASVTMLMCKAACSNEEKASIEYDALYAGAYTCRRLDKATAVCEHRYFESGIHLFPLPSSHAKGCVGLEYGSYAFLGDGAYWGVKGGRTVYNAGLLQALITALETLSADWFLQSHREPFLCSKLEVLASLRGIYERRNNQSPYIDITADS